jgi:lysophospholipase L1-like esterase
VKSGAHAGNPASTRSFSGALRRIGFVLAWAGLIAGCTDVQAGPRLARLPVDAVVLAFGDSLSAGNGAPPTRSYPAQLDALLTQRVVGDGVPGETTAQGLRRFDASLDRHAPDLVLLCLGGNDFLRRHDPAETEVNLDRMIAMATGRGVPVVLIGVPKPNLLLGDGDELYPRLAAKHGLPLENEILATVLSDVDLRADRIHPNAQGYARVASALRDLLVRAGAL